MEIQSFFYSEFENYIVFQPIMLTFRNPLCYNFWTLVFVTCFKRQCWWALNGHWHFMPIWKWCLSILGNCLRFLMLISNFFFQFSILDLLLTALLNWSSKFLFFFFFLYYFSRLLIFLFSWTFFLIYEILCFYYTFNFQVLFLFSYFITFLFDCFIS